MAGERVEQQADEFLLPNDFVLDLNGSLMVPVGMVLPSPWNLPSRLFQFPIEVSKQDKDGARRFGLMHPFLRQHPFVQQVEAQLGLKLDPDGAPNAFGVSQQRHAQWWHAVDLISSGHWLELIQTHQFTTDADIADAVTYGLDYSSHTEARPAGYISTTVARSIMRAIGSAQPSNPRAALELAEPMACQSEGGKARWPVNSADGSDPEGRAWSRIFGIESGWLKHDAAGFLQWTLLGREAFAAGDAATFTEQKTGQGSFAF